MEPINYEIGAVNPMAIVQLQQAGQQQLAQKQAAEQQALLRAEYDQAVSDAFDSGDLRKLSEVAMKYPDMAKNFKDVHTAMNDAEKKEGARVYGTALTMLENNRADLAKSHFKTVAEGLRNAGREQEASQVDQLISLVDKSPVIAKQAIAFGMANGDPAGYQKLLESPAFLRKAQADAANSETAAKYAAPLAESKLATDRMNIKKQLADIENDRRKSDAELERLGIDRGMLDLKRKELLVKLNEGPQLSPFLLKSQEEAQTEAVRAQDGVNRADALQAKLSQAPPGYLDRALGDWNSTFGTDWANTRNELASFLADAVRNNKPGQGNVTDTDLKFMQKGVPSENASAREISAWLTGFKSIQAKIASNQSMKALWIEQNGNLNRLKGDLQLDSGVVIPAGTSLIDAMNMNSKQMDKGKTQQQAPAQGLDYFMGRYGKG